MVLFAFDFEEGVDGCDGVDALVVVEVGELDEEDKFLDLDLIFLAIDDDHLAVEGFGDAAGGAASGEDVVEESEIDSVALGLAGGNVGEAVVDMVGTVFLHYLHIVQVAFGVGELAFLADGDDVLEGLGDSEQRSGKEEAACLDGDDIGAVGVCIDVDNQLVESLLVGKEGEYVDKVDARLGEVGIVVDDVGVINHERLWD